MSEHLKISIITPSYNQGEYIEKTIKSILDQGYPNLEYIVMDGGSRDETVEILKKYDARITYWQSEKDRGQTDAINSGFEKCTGDIVTWLCSDDYYEPNVLFEVEETFKKNGNINLVCGNRRTYGKGIEDTPYIGWRIKDSLEETMLFGSYDQPPSFFKKEAWDSIFPLTNSLRVYMDCEMWLRYLLKYGQDKAFHIDRLFANGLFHATSKSVNEAVPCRRVLNTLYYSIAQALELTGPAMHGMANLPKDDYTGKWNIVQDVDNERFAKFLIKRFGPQFNDDTYIYRDVAAYFLSLGGTKAALSNALDALKKEPFKLINIRTYLYCLRKNILS
jgi:glycosyltransferase involved in cell wall biosynthesis